MSQATAAIEIADAEIASRTSHHKDDSLGCMDQLLFFDKCDQGLPRQLARVASLQQALKRLALDVRVNLRAVDALVTEERLDVAHVHSVFEQVRRDAMPEAVNRRDGARDA